MGGMKRAGRAESARGRGDFAVLVVLALAAIEPGCGVSKSTIGVDAGADVVAGETGAEVSGAGTPASLCAFDRVAGVAATAQAVLAVAVDGAVTLVLSDGTLRDAYQFTNIRPTSGTVFSIRLTPAGQDFLAVGTWWGPSDPSVPCDLIDGHLSCPETDRFVRIARTGEIVSESTQHWIASSTSIGNPAPADAGTPDAADTPPDPSAFDWTFPAGLTPLGRSIDSQGWFIAILRDAYAADVYRSPDGMTAWTRLGKRLGRVEDVQVNNTAGTYFIRALGTASVFVPRQTWASDAPVERQPELLQDSAQLVRPATGVIDVLTYGADISVNVSPDGLCAVNWEATPMGRQLVTYDLTIAGSKRSFLRENLGIGVPNSLWLPPSSGDEGP